jgi:hypothetical protein
MEFYEKQNKRQKHALTSLLAFAACLVLFVYGMCVLGIFNKNKIIVATLATTGPDFEVVSGELKLQLQIPDTVQYSDVSGVMIINKSNEELNNCLEDGNAFLDDYFVLTEKVVGVKQSDSFAFHPLIEIYACKDINYFVFWILVILGIGLFLVFWVYYRKYKKTTRSILIDSEVHLILKR